jgi:hypothetical protein
MQLSREPFFLRMAIWLSGLKRWYLVLGGVAVGRGFDPKSDLEFLSAKSKSSVKDKYSGTPNRKCWEVNLTQQIRAGTDPYRHGSAHPYRHGTAHVNELECGAASSIKLISACAAQP